MFKALRKGETIWYAPDLTTAEKCRIRAFLCSKEAATTTGELLSA